MTIKRLILAFLIGTVASIFSMTSPAMAAPDAICVPWEPANPLNAHYTYSGAWMRVKGIARGGATEFYWDFGDGSPAMAWTPISNPHVLEAAHVYTGSVGSTYIATLHVRDGGGMEDQCSYLLRIHDVSDPNNIDHQQVRINMAIDEGLWWLHKQMVRGTYGAGAPGYGQPYGYWTDSYYALAATATAVDAFQLHGSHANGDYAGDPYVETVQRALNYILYNTYAYNIGPQLHGDPDYNDPVTGQNGIGLVANYTAAVNNSRQTYIGGISLVALASSGAPNRVAEVGGPYVYGRTYAEIVQDMVDFFAWGQVDSGGGRGGWRYYANYSGSDMSTTQWPPLGMIAAEENMGTTVPQFVRDELPYFLDAMQRTACDFNHGAFAYDPTQTLYNCTKAAAGIISHEFLHTPLDDPRVQAAIGFLHRHWNDTGGSWTYQRLLGSSYGMYGVMKAMRLPREINHYQPNEGILRIHEYDCGTGTQTPNSFDWFYTPGGQFNVGLASYVVQTQQPDGSWDDVPGPNAVSNAFATGWRVLILLKVIKPGPVAVICDCDEQEYNLGQDIHLDGSCSYHENPRRNVVGYEWDLDQDGQFDDGTGTMADIPGGFPITGEYPVRLRVTDDNPTGAQVDIVECKVDVHPPPHCPHAFADGPYLGFIGTPVTLDASASWDPDNPIASWEWDLDNDGLFGTADTDCFGEPSDAVGETAAWTWHGPYKGVIGLKVTDEAGQFSACSDYDYSTVDIGNHPPYADHGGPYTTCPGCTIMLDGSGSYDIDPGDAITLHEWDLDGDGDFDDCSGATCLFVAAPVAGTVEDVCLRVWDSFGEYGDGCTTVTSVSDGPRSTGFWKHQCSDLGFHQVEPEELNGFFAAVIDSSSAFGECAPVGCEVLRFEGRQNQMRPKANRQALALWLNVVSGRLPATTPISLPDLTDATSVEEAIAEIETILCDPAAKRSELEVAKDIAEALNLGGLDMELASLGPVMTVLAGERVSIPLGLVNMSPYARSYDLKAVGGWPVTLSDLSISELGSGALALLTAEVQVPANATEHAREPIHFIASDPFAETMLQRMVTVTLVVTEGGTNRDAPMYIDER